MSLVLDPIPALAGARANGFGLGVQAAPLPAGAQGWRPAGAAARDPRLLEALLDRTAAAAGTRSRAVAATWHLEKHAWYVVGVSLAAILAHGAMPPLEETLLHDADEGWPDAIAVPASGWEPAGGAELAARLEEHLAPLVEALARHRARRALWRCAGDRLGQAALWCGEAFGDRRGAWALASEALAAPSALAGPAGFELVDGLPFRRRAGCCLAHRSPAGAVCDDCGAHGRRRDEEASPGCRAG